MAFSVLLCRLGYDLVIVASQIFANQSVPEMLRKSKSHAFLSVIIPLLNKMKIKTKSIGDIKSRYHK